MCFNVLFYFELSLHFNVFYDIDLISYFYLNSFSIILMLYIMCF